MLLISIYFQTLFSMLDQNTTEFFANNLHEKKSLVPRGEKRFCSGLATRPSWRHVQNSRKPHMHSNNTSNLLLILLLFSWWCQSIGCVLNTLFFLVFNQWCTKQATKSIKMPSQCKSFCIPQFTPWFETRGAYHLTKKTDWGVESIMVSDLPVYRRNATSVTVWIQKRGEFV